MKSTCENNFIISALEDKTASEGQPIDTHPLSVYWRGGRKVVDSAK